jgi:inner membrane protein
MDPITHALSGALLASAAKRRAQAEAAAARPTTWKWFVVLAVAAAFPDIDISLEWVSNIATLTDRRGITHSLVLLPLWALILGSLFTLIFRERQHWRTYVLLSGIGMLLHIVFDLINAFGVMVLAPFSFHRFDWGIAFIIDLWLAGLLLLGLVASLFWRKSRVPALIAWAAVLAYGALMFWAKGTAEQAGQLLARQDTTRLGSTTKVDVYPRPLSPFNWTIVLTHADGSYRFTHVNLLLKEPIVAEQDAGFVASIRAAFRPVHLPKWYSATQFGQPASRAMAEKVWGHEDFKFFRDFADAPALIAHSVTVNSAGGCAFFEDLRFVSPGREAHPFRYGMCFTGEGARVYAYRDGEPPVLVPHPRRLLFAGR